MFYQVTWLCDYYCDITSHLLAKSKEENRKIKKNHKRLEKWKTTKSTQKFSDKAYGSRRGNKTIFIQWEVMTSIIACYSYIYKNKNKKVQWILMCM